MQAETQVLPVLEQVAPPRAPESKKPRARKIAHQTIPETSRQNKTQRPSVKPVPIIRPDAKAIPPKRPILKRVVIEKSAPDDKPESIEPVSQPMLKRLPIETVRKSDAEPIETDHDKFVVVARAVAPVEPKSIEQTPTNGNESEESTEEEDIVIRIPRKKSIQVEPAVEEQLVDPTPTQEQLVDSTSTVDQSGQPDVAPRHVEPTEIEKHILVEPIQTGITQPTGSIAIESKTEIKSPVVLETELPPLEGIAIKPTRRLHVDHLPGARMIAGNLARTGIVVVIENSRGHQTMVFTGTAPHYGAGGFETMVDEDGMYRVLIEGQTIEVKLQGETAFIHAG
jgi:hypothetical protein